MRNVFFNFKKIFLPLANFFRCAGSIIELFPTKHPHQPLSKKYHFVKYISDDQVTFRDWKQVGDDLRAVMAVACRQQSHLIKNDTQECEVLNWIESASDDEGWK